MTTTAASATTPARLGAPFRAHLGAVGLANLADGIVQTGVPLLAIALTRDPFIVGLLTAAVWLPWLVGAPLAGVFVDRWDRRVTMMAALGLRAGLLGLVGVVAATGSLTVWWLIGLALAYGFTEVFTDLSAAAQVPALVGREPTALQAANSRLFAVEAATNTFAGPPLAGLLVGLSATWAIGVPGVLVGVAVLVLLTCLRGRFVAEARPDVVPDLRRELVEGISVTFRHPVLRPLAISSGMWNFASSAFSAVILLWMVGEGSAGGLTETQWSLVVVAMPVGAIAGSLVAGKLLARWPEMRVMVVCWGGNAVLNLIPLLWPTIWGLALFLLFVGPLGVIGNVVSSSLRPRMVPPDLLGKVTGAGRMVAFGSMPLGALMGGAAATLWGIPTVLLGVVAVMLVATALVWRTVPGSLVRRYELAADAG